MRPSVALERNRQAIREIVARNLAANPRVFGSVARGEDRDDSDLDLLVDALPGLTYADMDGLKEELEGLLGLKVDVVTEASMRPRIRAKAMAEARPL